MTKTLATTTFEAHLNWVRTSADRPETVVLIHGVGYDLTYWDRQIEALREEYNVVALDLPGHGLSTGAPEEWSFDNATGIMVRLIEEVSAKPVHLVGVSFGGMIAEITTLARPDLIRSLTLVGSAARFPEEVRSGMRARAKTLRVKGMADIVQATLERHYTLETRTQRPDLIDRVTKTFLGDDPATQAAIWEVIADLDVHARLGEIRCPTLILVGEHDPITPPGVARELFEAIAGSKMEIIAAAGHIIPVETPTAVNNALRTFLNR